MNRSLKRSTDTRQNTNLRRSNALPPIRQPNSIKINLQRRKKLGQSLTQSMIKKFNDKTQNDMIEKEVNEFLKRENLTEKDLKDLEKKISQKIKSKKSNDELTKKLISGTKPQIVELNEEKKVENENINPQILNENIQNEQKQDLNTSAMSGGSDLEKFDGKYAKEEMDASELKELEKYKNSNNEPTVKKVVLDTNKYNDEWDAINMYQKRMFQERERREKTKELEMKMRNRADLLNQIQQKIKRKYDEELKDKEYAIIIEQNVKKMDELERKQKEAKKQQILKEKEIRDKQLRDIYVAKRIAFLKNKKYEKELIEHNNEEIRLAKEAALIQKEKEHDALLKTLKDNELHKQKILEQERIERENDIKIMEDAAANEIKKENERKAYYESIKRGQAEHDTKMLESVIKKRNEQLKEEENILNNFWKNQGVLDRENEIRRKIEMKENQKKLKMFYDKQVEEKKAKKEFERQVDLAQGRIWKQDYLNYLQYENDTSRRIKEMIDINYRHNDILNAIQGVKTAVENMSMNVNQLTVNATGITYNVNNTQVDNSITTYNTNINQVYNVENNISADFNTYNQQFTPDFTSSLTALQDTSTMMNGIITQINGVQLFTVPILLTLAGIVLLAILG